MTERRPGAHCKRKLRFATQADAEATAEGIRLREHVVRAEKLQAYFCTIHGVWHLGHLRYPKRRTSNTGEAIGRLFTLRATLIAEFGKTQDVVVWCGVRALSGALRYLTAHPWLW